MKALTKTDYEFIDKIVDRAIKMGFYKDNRVTAHMDVANATKHFNMRLEEWLNADNFNFAHDIVGIYKAINREKYPADFSNDPWFLPRFAGKEE
jgi:hypothetical protein